MIIDCHTHIGRNEHIKASADELLHSMDKSGIDKSLVFAGSLNDAPIEWVLEQIAPHKDRLLGVGAYRAGVPDIDPGRANQLVDLYLDKKIVAVKFYTGYDHYYPNQLFNTLSKLEQVGCPAIFHCGDCLNSVKKAKLKYAHPLGIDDVAVDFPNMNFIIAHVGFPWHRDAAEVCYKNNNVYADISGFVYGEFSAMDKIKFKKTINEFLDISSSGKLLFGTDFPISNQKSYLNAIDDCYGEALTAQALTKNVKKVFKL